VVRISGGYKDYLFEMQFKTGFFSCQKVAVMYGIKGSTHNTDLAIFRFILERFSL
jgi:hypothetical protein